MTQVETFLAGQGLGSRIAYWIARVAVYGFCRVWTRVEVEGRENVPATGAFVLAPVHRSNMDTPFASCVTRRRLRFMGKDTLWKRQPAAWFLSALGGFPVTRGTADREALKRCIAVLQAGDPLVLFPEGERKSGPTVQPLFDGPAYVALKTNVPVVPVGIGGSEAVMPKGAKFIRPSKVHIIVGTPITRRAVVGRVPRATIQSLTDELHATLQELFDEAQARVDRGSPQPQLAK
jgi:1-acyl-sn-glycerol-3-phosphate acyltransferase